SSLSCPHSVAARTGRLPIQQHRRATQWHRSASSDSAVCVVLALGVAIGGGSCGDNATPNASPDASIGGELVLRAGRLGGFGNADDVGTDARFTMAKDVAVDSVGNIFVVDAMAATIRRIAAGGVVSTFAGRYGEQGRVDGTGDTARFQFPMS